MDAIVVNLLQLLLGFAVGAFGTLVGIGGGFVLVPLFLLVFQWSPQYAVGTSLTVVFLNAISGTFAYVRQKKVYYDAAVRFSIATLPGALLGSYMAQYFSGAIFRLTFGIFVILIACLMVFSSSRVLPTSKFSQQNFTYNRSLGILMSMGVGFISSVLGIGGGLIHVPAMVYLLDFPPHIATATSHFVLAVSAGFGVFSHYLLGHILTVPAVLIGAGAVAGAQLGARLSLKVESRVIMLLLTLTLFLMGLRLIFSVY